jgi:hypothetical protein
MITVEEIRVRARANYRRFLIQTAAALIVFEKENTPFFPLVIKGDKGSVNDNFSERSKELADLIAHSANKTGQGYTIEVRETNSRQNARQTKIEKLVFTTEADYLWFIGKKRETARFRSALSVFLEQSELSRDALYDWSVTELDELQNEHETDFWQNIIRCCIWFKNNPQSNLYIREIPLAVHTKFIEENERLIHGLLCPDRLVSFEKQHGLRDKPRFVRFRSLSKNPPVRIGEKEVAELMLPFEDFAGLPETPVLSGIEKIFIIENEIVYRTFPEVEHALCIWGAGYEVAKLSSCTFLSAYELYYFGDLDEHGFDLLSLHRSYFPQTHSFCMDLQTFLTFRTYCVSGKVLPADKIPGFLTDDERAVFMKLRSDPAHNRLEQERISNQYLTGQLSAVFSH